MDYTVSRILQARILEWVAFPFSRRSSQPRDRTQISRIAGRFFPSWATREACNLEVCFIYGHCWGFCSWLCAGTNGRKLTYSLKTRKELLFPKISKLRFKCVGLWATHKLWRGHLSINWVSLTFCIFPFISNVFTSFCFSFCSKICIFIRQFELFFNKSGYE